MRRPDSFKGPYWEPRDVWFGAFWDRTRTGLHVYLCLVPCFPIRLTWEPQPGDAAP
jgi:hypothetical protein